MESKWTDRTELLLGTEKMGRLQNAHVLVVGVGGVGAYAAEMLCRAGVGEMTLIDADTVSLTNINRQLPATHATIGQFKTEVLAERFRTINPDIKLHVLPVYVAPLNSQARPLCADESAVVVNAERSASPRTDAHPASGKNPTDDSNTPKLQETITIDALLNQFTESSPLGGSEGGLFIVDAIDTIAPKCALVIEALRRHIPIVSSMGAGAKSDITQIRFADIWDTYHCGLAKAVRTRLKKAGIRRSLPVVFSTEQADRRAVITVEGEQNKKSTAGTISYMPAVFGCYLAEYVIRHI